MTEKEKFQQAISFYKEKSAEHMSKIYEAAGRGSKYAVLLHAAKLKEVEDVISALELWVKQ